jgi:pimeloyl-ACP methyl ester carboxylesterase
VGLKKVLRQKSDGRWHWHWDPAFMSRRGSEVPAPDFQGLFEVALANIAVPTLLVRGKLSDVVTEDGARDFLAKIPHAKLADVSDAAHMVAGDQNDAFSSAVTQVLAEDVRPTLPG